MTHTCARTLIVFVLIFAGSVFAPAQDTSTPPPPCHLGPFGRAVGRDGVTALHGIAVSPREAIRPKNLLWELPVGAATGLLIATGADRRTANHFTNPKTESHWSTVSDVGIGAELGVGAIGWMVGCAKDEPTLANSTFTALAAAGYAQVLNLGIKEAFRRQYPYQANSTGAFFSRSRAGSFTSGHATTSFAFAAAIAKRYPHNHWVVFGSYALAAGISLARLPAKRHYPSDVLVGAAIGAAMGTYIGDHAAPSMVP